MCPSVRACFFVVRHQPLPPPPAGATSGDPTLPFALPSSRPRPNATARSRADAARHHVRLVPTLVLDTVDDDGSVAAHTNPLLLPPRGAASKRQLLRLHDMSADGDCSCVAIASAAELETRLDEVLAVVTRQDALSSLRTRGALVSLDGGARSDVDDGACLVWLGLLGASSNVCWLC